MRTKERNNELIARAFGLFTLKNDKGEIISSYSGRLMDKTGFINDAYSGQIAAFAVSVAMVGLKPTVAMYYKQGGSSVDTHNIVGLIAEMLVEDGYNYSTNDNQEPAKKFFEDVMNPKGSDANKLRKAVIDNAVALKVVVRTFVKSDKDEKSA